MGIKKIWYPTPISSHIAALIVTLIFTLTVAGCASKILKYDNAEELKRNDEFAKAVKIEIPELPPAPSLPTPSPSLVGTTPSTTTTTTLPATKVAKIKNKKKSKIPIPEAPVRRQPELESDEDFDGRRPIKDPFRVGERVIHDITYTGLTAGQLTIEVGQWAQVNGRKSYQLAMSLKSSSLFSKFYAVEDSVTTLMDYESLVPSVYTLAVKESSQLREAQMYFDWNENHANFWEKKVTEKAGREVRKLDWEIPLFSQNVFSAIFYLRVFKWEVGKTHSFRVSHDNENLVFKATALRREKIETAVGEFTALVIKPEIELQGFFKSIGDNFIWISDDDRKLVLRIESKIKIGSLVTEIVEIQPGTQ